MAESTRHVSQDTCRGTFQNKFLRGELNPRLSTHLYHAGYSHSTYKLPFLACLWASVLGSWEEWVYIQDPPEPFDAYNPL